VGSQRSLLRNISAGTAGKRHSCKANNKHVFAKGDPLLIVKIERTDYHYCVPCAQKFIATAKSNLSKLEAELLATPDS
jgi:hypothetical protein